MQGHHELRAELFAVELALEVLELLGDVLGCVVGNVGVQLIPEPLGDVHGRGEGLPAAAGRGVDQGEVLEVLGADAEDDQPVAGGTLEPVDGQRDVAERGLDGVLGVTPGMKFIGGEPMNPATNMFAGAS